MVILPFYLERNVLCQLIHSVQLTHLKTPLQSELLGVGHSGVFLIFSVISMFSRLA